MSQSLWRNCIWFYPFAVSFKKFDFSLHITLCSVFKVQSSRGARRSQSRFSSFHSLFSFGKPAPLSGLGKLCGSTKPFLCRFHLPFPSETDAFVRAWMILWITKSLQLVSLAVFLSENQRLCPGLVNFAIPAFAGFGGLKWTRTTDLALIRRAL